MIKKICKVCKKEFDVFEYRNQSAIFCSYTCMGKGNQGKQAHNRKNLPDDEICERYKSGVTQTELAKVYNVSIATISNRLDMASIQKRKPTGNNLRNKDAIEKAKRNHPTGKSCHNFADIPVDEIIKKYKNGNSTISIANEYGVSPITIGRKLKKHGIKMRTPGFSRNRKCKDGHIVSSAYEQAVDNWLFRHNIKHEIHPPCPWPSKWPSNPRSDFLVNNNVYIEVWGVEGNKEYDERRLNKIKLYKSVNAKLIQIFPHHILDNDYSPLLDLI